MRAFEAAARHLSFTKAAAELRVTPAAISHQVKALEAQVGVSLFRRLNNGIVLTAAGARYLPSLTEGFDRLAEAGRKLHEPGGSHVVTVGALHSVATKWLAPRLAGFYQAHPGIDVRVVATDRAVDPRREDLDLTILYGAAGQDGDHAEVLFQDQVFPVCAPATAAGPPPLQAPGDLERHTLLHIDWDPAHGASPDWRSWLAAAGVPQVDATRGPRFTLSGMAIQAAVDGQGVALGQHLFAADDMAAGRLVKPFELSLPLESAYYLVVPKSLEERPAAVLFRQWLEAEAARYKALIRTSGMPC